MSHGRATPLIIRDRRLKAGWRAAAAAYRRAYGEVRNRGRGPADEAYAAAVAAFKEAVPGISDEEARSETVEAISYASWAHPKWLYALTSRCHTRRDGKRPARDLADP